MEVSDCVEIDYREDQRKVHNSKKYKAIPCLPNYEVSQCSNIRKIGDMWDLPKRYGSFYRSGGKTGEDILERFVTVWFHGKRLKVNPKEIAKRVWGKTRNVRNS